MAGKTVVHCFVFLLFHFHIHLFYFYRFMVNFVKLPLFLFNRDSFSQALKQNFFICIHFYLLNVKCLTVILKHSFYGKLSR